MGFSGEKGKSDFSFPWCDLNMNVFLLCSFKSLPKVKHVT